MKSVMFPSMKRLAGVILFCCYQIKAEEGPAEVYSVRDVTGGVIVEIEHVVMTVRERNGKQRTFVTFNDSNGKTRVEVNGRVAEFEDIKVGMRVQITFYCKSDGRKLIDEEDAFPIISVKATTLPP
jgi:hypothetical protein